MDGYKAQSRPYQKYTLVSWPPCTGLLPTCSPLKPSRCADQWNTTLAFQSPICQCPHPSPNPTPPLHPIACTLILSLSWAFFGYTEGPNPNLWGIGAKQSFISTFFGSLTAYGNPNSQSKPTKACTLTQCPWSCRGYDSPRGSSRKSRCSDAETFCECASCTMNRAEGLVSGLNWGVGSTWG